MKVNMKRRTNESGLVSIVVCMIIMIIIALITISFATLARREQRQALDKQLSSQAFYAAETGINDALAAIASGTLTGNITTCDDAAQNQIKPSAQRTLNGAVAFTCVFVNQTPPQIVDTVKIDTSSIFKISATGLTRLNFKWENDDKTQPQMFTNSSSGFLPYSGATKWDGNVRPGVLRIELIPVRNTRAASADTIDVFGFPTDLNTSSTHDASDTANNGELLTGNCTQGGGCNISLTGLSGEYYLRMVALYDAVKVTVTGVDNINAPVSFVGAQAEIDSTGKSSDVLRRIKIYKSLLSDKSGVPGNTLTVGDDLCKRLRSNSNQTIVDGLSAAGYPQCQPDGNVTVTPPPPPVVTTFPGDPRPFGKAYWGASIGGNGSPSRHENAPGITKSLSARRTYWQWTDALDPSSGMYNTVRSDLQNNRLPLISIKPPALAAGISSWDRVGNTTTYDAQLDGILTRLDDMGDLYGGPIWVVFHHEPEGGGASGNNPDDIGGPIAWRAMQRKVRERMDALSTDNLAFMPILMTYTWDPASGRNPNQWWEPGIWDAFIVDHFQTKANGDMFSVGSGSFDAWDTFLTWIKDPSRNLPFGTGEWGNTCKQFSCAATAAAGGVEAANEMQAFWDAGFPVNDKNVIIHSYFDSSLNSGSSPFNSWELQGLALQKYRNILQNDTRIMRINDIP